MGWEEAQDYTLFLHLPLASNTLLFSKDGLNADEVVEYAHEYGIEIPYENLPTEPGEIVAGENYQIEWPKEMV